MAECLFSQRASQQLVPPFDKLRVTLLSNDGRVCLFATRVATIGHALRQAQGDTLVEALLNPTAAQQSPSTRTIIDPTRKQRFSVYRGALSFRDETTAMRAQRFLIAAALVLVAACSNSVTSPVVPVPSPAPAVQRGKIDAMFQ